MHTQQPKKVTGQRLIDPCLMVDTASLYMWLRMNDSGFSLDYRQLVQNVSKGLDALGTEVARWKGREAWITNKGNHSSFRDMLDGFGFSVVKRASASIDVHLSVAVLQKAKECDSLVVVTANANLHVALKALIDSEDRPSQICLVSFASVLHSPAFQALDCDKIEMGRDWYWT